MNTLKIERFRFQSLKNVEFTLVVPHIIEISEKYPCVLQHLEKRLESVKAFLPELGKIEAQERKWQDAKQLDEYERLRDSYVNTLIRTERTYSRVAVPGYEEASAKLTALFDKHGRDIADDRNTAETQRLYNLAEDIERTAGMADALAALALTPVYNAMKEANIRFDELWQKRNAELSAIEHVDSKTIRAACVKAINAMYDGIEYWAAENEDVAEWRQLIAEFSQLGNYYNQQIKARTTRRKNRESGEDDLLIEPKTE
ncbi:MAG: DUF6261 family protein [Prevotellaceae bacterium]|jgi:hypothetical protein|nr:DUF6261 family protein [Prevotellaceae bacterium]